MALAGVFQAAYLAQQFARTGKAECAPFICSVNSVLKIDAGTTREVYGGIQGVALGLKLLHDKLGGRAGPHDVELARYVIAMIQLASKLKNRIALLEAIRNGINEILSQMKFFQQDEQGGEVHPSLPTKLAQLYLKTISTLRPRIIVSGEQDYLANNTIADNIRTTLFAGIRSAFLWHQLGGSRWQLLISRRKIMRSAGELLDNIAGAAAS